jgi:hypothetical protein
LTLTARRDYLLPGALKLHRETTTMQTVVSIFAMDGTPIAENVEVRFATVEHSGAVTKTGSLPIRCLPALQFGNYILRRGDGWTAEVSLETILDDHITFLIRRDFHETTAVPPHREETPTCCG